MQLVVFATVGIVAFLVAYAFGLGGTVSALIFLAILFMGATLRVAQPLLAKLKP